MSRFLFVVLFFRGLFADYTQINEISARVQWDHNSGYCGEVSFISAGLYYGQYLSQYDARRVVTENQQEEILLGINDRKAAKKMHLDAVFWNSQDTKSTTDFLAWVKAHSFKGYPVIIGVYENQWLFHQDPDPKDGDSEYDHIVVVNGITSHSSSDEDSYSPDDHIWFLDNGLWSERKDHQFEYSFASFQKTRKEANDKEGSVYSLPKTSWSKKVANYGVAILGVKDLSGDTLPVRIIAKPNYEWPEIGKKSNVRPKATPVELSITVSELEPGVSYILYRYNDLSLVPDSKFNRHAKNAQSQREINIQSGSSFTISETIQSDEIAVYRAVRASAP